MEDQERIEEQEDVEGHAKKNRAQAQAGDEGPTDELAESDDVEAHRLRKQAQ